MVLPAQLKIAVAFMSVVLYCSPLKISNQPVAVEDGFYVVNNQGKQSLKYKDMVYHLDNEPFCLTSSITKSAIEPAIGLPGKFELTLVLDEEGTSALNRATNVSANENRFIAFVVKKKIVLVAFVAGRISGGRVSIAGQSKNELQQIQSNLK